ncbi:MAG: hypothetical protein OXE94_01505 [Aestuariivita sp.]|nr:hypothetical protein [Aestuariivita sp.]MCY4202181.1 hypothetical protein [Aestuariivita sp.]MCY4289808.1 hypothetical protein [Aestuariivita sp.]MCY4347436.1 hypothetical protein [Aestuariivita sp.]
MNVKAAVHTAKEYVAELYSDELARHIGVEEVVFDELSSTWKVTIGFFGHGTRTSDCQGY